MDHMCQMNKSFDISNGIVVYWTPYLSLEKTSSPNCIGGKIRDNFEMVKNVYVVKFETLFRHCNFEFSI